MTCYCNQAVLVHVLGDSCILMFLHTHTVYSVSPHTHTHKTKHRVYLTEFYFSVNNSALRQLCFITEPSECKCLNFRFNVGGLLQILTLSLTKQKHVCAHFANRIKFMAMSTCRAQSDAKQKNHMLLALGKRRWRVDWGVWGWGGKWKKTWGR